MPPLLSKSKYLLGLQCPKYLWISVHEKERIPAPDVGTQARFDQGHLVGELAKKLFPGGVDIPSEDFKGNLVRSKKLLSLRKPLFEAAFSTGGLYSRADVLCPAEDDFWSLIEVKSSTEVKDVNLHDVSFQQYCFRRAGLNISKCYLMYVNNEYVRKGEISPKDFFTMQDITKEVEETGHGIKERIAAMQKVLSSPKCPDCDIGLYCHDPYECPIEECWEKSPERSVFTLYWGTKLSFELYKQGIVEIKDIPATVKLNDKQQIQVWCEKRQKPHVHKEAITHFLAELKEPLQFLDFETFSLAVPPYDGLRPYQRVPFQFSLHTQKSGKTGHFGFLAEGKDDPRPAFVKALKAAILPKGSIIAYNASFEKGVIKELAEAFPKEKPWLCALNDRFIDLYAPFRSFHLYHPDQHGSTSIKAVLPALTGNGYENLDIAGGEDASQAYLDMAFGDLSKAEKEKIRKDLEKYCEMDTKAMILVLEKLNESINPG